MKNKQILITAAIVLLVGAGSFVAGYKVSSLKSRFGGGRQQLANMRGNVQPGKMMGQRNPSGEITAMDDKSITLKLVDGSSKIVVLNDKTVVSKSAEANKSELKVGSKVAIFGTVNSDGSMTAGNIEINPKMLGQPGNLR